LEAADGAHEAPVLDPVVLAELHRSGELLRRLIAAFTREAPEQLGQIARAIARHDLENAAITAHALKGTAVTFGASRMRESAAALENAADGGAEGRALSELNRLRGECERVSRELQADQSRQTP
jgi:HPt (histidine-containing phosphotransfer) domain-containing protein